MSTKRTDYRAKRIMPMLLSLIKKHSFSDEDMRMAQNAISDLYTGKQSFIIFNDDYNLKFIMSASPKSQKKSRILL